MAQIYEVNIKTYEDDGSNPHQAAVVRLMQFIETEGKRYVDEANPELGLSDSIILLTITMMVNVIMTVARPDHEIALAQFITSDVMQAVRASQKDRKEYIAEHGDPSDR